MELLGFHRTILDNQDDNSFLDSFTQQAVRLVGSYDSTSFHNRNNNDS